MASAQGMASAIQAVLERDPLIALEAQPAIDIEMRHGTVLLRGEVNDIAAKRRIAARVASMPGVDSVLDQLRVAVTRPRGDGAIAATLHSRLASENVFGSSRIQICREADTEAQTEGREILIEVNNGVVTLTGEVESLSHRRFADVLAWWTPGVADVDNRLLVRPREEDNDGEIADALRLVLEKDPTVDASRIHAQTHDGTVRLAGIVYCEEQKRHAELDAWCILGVHEVENMIEVRN